MRHTTNAGANGQAFGRRTRFMLAESLATIVGLLLTGCSMAGQEQKAVSPVRGAASETEYLRMRMCLFKWTERRIWYQFDGSMKDAQGKQLRNREGWLQPSTSRSVDSDPQACALTGTMFSDESIGKSLISFNGKSTAVWGAMVNYLDVAPDVSYIAFSCGLSNGAVDCNNKTHASAVLEPGTPSVVQAPENGVDMRVETSGTFENANGLLFVTVNVILN